MSPVRGYPSSIKVWALAPVIEITAHYLRTPSKAYSFFTGG